MSSFTVRFLLNMYDIDPKRNKFKKRKNYDYNKKEIIALLYENNVTKKIFFNNQGK